jgi:hypothetical protein
MDASPAKKKKILNKIMNDAMREIGVIPAIPQRILFHRQQVYEREDWVPCYYYLSSFVIGHVNFLLRRPLLQRRLVPFLTPSLFLTRRYY